MGNPFNSLNPRNPMRGYNFDAISGMLGAIRGNNPMQILQRAASSNPALQPVVNSLSQGANPQQVFYSLCQQRGIDPQEFLRRITGNNGR